MATNSTRRLPRAVLAVVFLFFGVSAAVAGDVVEPTMVRNVASRLDAIYLDHGMGGLVGDEKRCYAAAGTHGSGLRLCMLYDMAVKSLDTGIKNYFDVRGGVNPDPSAPYQSDQAFGGRMKLDTYYAFHGSVDDATAYYGDAVVAVLQAVADRRQQLDRIEVMGQPTASTSQALDSVPATVAVVGTRRPPSAHKRTYALAYAASRK